MWCLCWYLVRFFGWGFLNVINFDIFVGVCSVVFVVVVMVFVEFEVVVVIFVGVEGVGFVDFGGVWEFVVGFVGGLLVGCGWLRVSG